MQRLYLEIPETKLLKDPPDSLLSYLAAKSLDHEVQKNQPDTHVIKTPVQSRQYKPFLKIPLD